MDIQLKEYFMLLKKRIWLIVVIVLAATIPTSIYSNLNYQPIYMASTKLIVNKTSEKDLGKEQIDYAYIGINIALINTYKEIIKTPAIMDKVVQRYPDLNMTADELVAATNVSDLKETQVMTITAKHSSYEKAVTVANAVSDVFQTEVPKIMKVDNITILNRAKMQDHPIPINQKSNQYFMLSLVASLVVAIGVIFFLEALDDTVKSEDDVRKLFGVSTLALVPKYTDKELKNERRSKSRGKTGEAPYAKTSY